MSKKFEDLAFDRTESFHNDHDNQIDNNSGNQSFSYLLEKSIHRRSLIKGGTAAAIISFADTGLTHSSLNPVPEKPNSFSNKTPIISFSPVAIEDASGPTPSISNDYQFEVILPWGAPLKPSGPKFNYPVNAKDQADQIGIGHDGMAFFPDPTHSKRKKNRQGMLALNHEYGKTRHIIGKEKPQNLDDVHAVQHAHGVSILALKKTKRHGAWQQQESLNARRIHVNSPVTFSGPVANSPLIKTVNGNSPLGTLNNCSNGVTPWGTYLTCEENFNGYFGASNKKNNWQATKEQKRYGFSENGFGYDWHAFDDRFDLSNNDFNNEENRFGWIVEIDPFDASQIPVKRTALGRFKHEGIAITQGRNQRIVAYMGDDQRFDYIYKFVSSDNWQSMRAKGISPLDEGQLYVARFNEDGSGQWLALNIENPILAKRFKNQAEVLVYARLAADLLKATPMDRPEWTDVAPNGDVYCTLTNNTKRTAANAANPFAPNPHGHIIRWRDEDNHVGINFTWDIFLSAQNTQEKDHCFSNPDGLMVDDDGRIFILTDGGQKEAINNQLLVTDEKASTISRLFTGVKGCEITGITSTPDQRTLFVNIQHPGNGNPKITNFPATQDGKTIPRDCTVAITRKDGGIVGS